MLLKQDFCEESIGIEIPGEVDAWLLKLFKKL